MPGAKLECPEAWYALSMTAGHEIEVQRVLRKRGRSKGGAYRAPYVCSRVVNLPWQRAKYLVGNGTMSVTYPLQPSAHKSLFSQKPRSIAVVGQVSAVRAAGPVVMCRLQCASKGHEGV